MSRSAIFKDNYPKSGKRPKNLRDNCREFADWANGREPEVKDHAITNQKYGRSSGTNN